YYKDFQISKENDNRFRVSCNIESLINEINEEFSFIFESAIIQVEVYNACNNFYCYYRPWDYLHNLCYNIKTKADHSPEYVNEKEKKLMPLITEIRNFEYWGKCETIECFEFSELKKIVRKFEYIEIEEMLNKIEKVNCNDKNFYNTVEKLYSILNKKQYEPLFREIYNKIAQSQEQYPTRVETLCDKEMLENARSDIQTLMESKGYSGTYPDFYKIDSMKGIHLASSYNQTYFVGIEKNVKSHIHCTEEIDDEGLSIQFLCGTALLKKGEDETDIFGYSFNAKGRRLFDTIFYRISFEEYKAYNELKDLETYISIAVKKAECKNLNKEERTTIYGPLGGLGTFLTVFLVGGGLFAIFMTLAMMIICTLTTIAFGLFNDIPEMFKVMPWWQMFGFAWIGFGGLMGITEFLAKRK
ncbi:MAG: DUF3878 family protein, partial [Clostridia bacterium]|nr:DUF3878 family protein [Clostridia bacterium]